MVKCTCGKAIEKVPTWLSVVTVEFVCNNCPNRTAKNIAFVDLSAGVAPKTPTENQAGFAGEEEANEEED